MRRRWRWCVALAAIGCSNLPSAAGGIVALEVRLPSPAALEQNDTLTLRARALDANGDSVATQAYWRLLDDTLATLVDSIGVVTTSRTSGSPRLQAHVGSLRSEIVTLTVRPRSDTLALTVADTITVPAADNASDTLGVAVRSNAPAGGVAGTSIVFEVVDSVAAKGALEFSNGLLVIRATTGSDGAPATAVTLRKVLGQIPPGTVQVRVSATRPSGTVVPGSGQLFTLLFQ
jgi:hypothetical protein